MRTHLLILSLCLPLIAEASRTLLTPPFAVNTYKFFDNPPAALPAPVAGNPIGFSLVFDINITNIGTDTTDGTFQIVGPPNLASIFQFNAQQNKGETHKFSRAAEICANGGISNPSSGIAKSQTGTPATTVNWYAGAGSFAPIRYVVHFYGGKYKFVSGNPDTFDYVYLDGSTSFKIVVNQDKGAVIATARVSIAEIPVPTTCGGMNLSAPTSIFFGNLADQDTKHPILLNAGRPF